MPIRPENRALYPADWKEIRATILDPPAIIANFAKLIITLSAGEIKKAVSMIFASTVVTEKSNKFGSGASPTV